MKKLIFLLLFAPLSIWGQKHEHPNWKYNLKERIEEFQKDSTNGIIFGSSDTFFVERPVVIKKEIRLMNLVIITEMNDSNPSVFFKGGGGFYDCQVIRHKDFHDRENMYNKAIKCDNLIITTSEKPLLSPMKDCDGTMLELISTQSEMIKTQEARIVILKEIIETLKKKQ